MTGPRFKFRELVDVTIKGVRVVGEHDLSGRITIADEDGDCFELPAQAAITRVAPAEWPPQSGDLWRRADEEDDDGCALWFAHLDRDYDGDVEGAPRIILVPADGDLDYAETDPDTLISRSTWALVRREPKDGEA